MSDRTRGVSVHRLRRTARKQEREIQLALNTMREHGISAKLDNEGGFWLPLIGAPKVWLPGWTQGVRTEKTGLLQFTVVATEHRGT